MTTVISVNQAEQPEHPEDSMLRPEPAVVPRTNSNRSTANETKDSIVKGKKLGHRRVKDGEVTYKKFETTQLMGSIQLGIQQSVGNLGCQEDRDLLHEDFYTVETVIFSRDGTLQKTPAHNYSQFKVRRLLGVSQTPYQCCYFSLEPLRPWRLEFFATYLVSSEISSWCPCVQSR